MIAGGLSFDERANGGSNYVGLALPHPLNAFLSLFGRIEGIYRVPIQRQASAGSAFLPSRRAFNGRNERRCLRLHMLGRKSGPSAFARKAIVGLRKVGACR